MSTSETILERKSRGVRSRKAAGARRRVVSPLDSSASVGLSAGLIEQIVRKIVQRFKPIRIVLFGSRARGDARPDSDIDLFVEMESPRGRHDATAEILGLFGLRSWSMDLIVYTPAEVRKNRGMVGFIMDEIEKEGLTLYAQTEAKH